MIEKVWVFVWASIALVCLVISSINANHGFHVEALVDFFCFVVCSWWVDRNMEKILTIGVEK